MDGGFSTPQFYSLRYGCDYCNQRPVALTLTVLYRLISEVIREFLLAYISRNTLVMALASPGRSQETPESYAKPHSPSPSPLLRSSSSPSPENFQGPAEKRFKQSNGSDNRSFSREDRCVYGNPKDVLKPSPPVDSFDATTVLDLSCKSSKSDEGKTKPQEPTYQNYPRNPHPYLPDPFQRSNLEIKLVNPPKRPSPNEQLQIAKLQQQQRRCVQQQQKMLQQMRRSLDGGRQSTKPEGVREEPHTPAVPPAFPQNPHNPYLDTQGKELPDGHPILPLLDPVYFSALYNAHGFLPPSSPSIAAAFIGTLQDALPKLSMMFPPIPPASTSASSSHLHQKTGDNLN